MSATGVSIDLVRELRAICGEEHVRATEPLPRRPARADDTVDLGEIAETKTQAVVAPASVEEISAVLRLANARGLSVLSSGGRSEFVPIRCDVFIRTGRLNEVEHYDHADLTVGIGAGMTVEHLSKLVGADHLMFACDPAVPECASIGGVLAAAKHGPLRHGYGGVRDFCIGVRFVTGDGRVGKGGGRVVKNVAGYDLMKLLIGSYGTLAVITSASFKLFPAPRQTRTYVAEFASWQQALDFRDLVMRSPLSPMCLELVSPHARKWMRPEMAEDAWVVGVRASGSDAVLARYRKELGSAVTREIDGANELQMWHAVQNFPFSEEAAEAVTRGSELSGTFRPMSIFVPIAEVGTVVQIIEGLSHPDWAVAAYIGRFGLGHLAVMFQPDQEVTFGSHEEALLKRLPKAAQVRWSWLSENFCAPLNLESLKAVKRALDPNNVLRGREMF